MANGQAILDGSGSVDALILAGWQHLGLVGTSAQILAVQTLTRHTALVALALGLHRARPLARAQRGHASTSARWRLAHRL